MDWLEHTLRENPYISGAIVCVATFIFLHVFSRPRPVRTAATLVGGVSFGILSAFEVMHSWPPALVQSQILVGTILTCFLFGLMLSRLGSISFDTATHEFVLEQSIVKSALTALFIGVFVALAPLFYDKVGVGDPLLAAWCAWMSGGTLGQWLRILRAEGA